MPRIEAFGLATAAEIDINTLAARLEAEAVALGSQLGALCSSVPGFICDNNYIPVFFNAHRVIRNGAE